MSLTKVVAVTGASRGIGSGIVKELASHGHVIGCLSRKGIGPEDQEVAGRLMTLPCDMENEEQISNAINELVKKTGRIDVLINNAALHLEGGGLIINLGSFFDRLGPKRNLAYNCSKTAIGALTRTLAVEWARHKIRVLNLAPGFVATDLNSEHMANNSFKEFVQRRIPVGHTASVKEVAQLVAMLVNMDLPSLTGETIFLDSAQNINQ